VQQLRIVFKFLRYYFTANTKYKVHSPFVFELVTEVIKNKNTYYAYKEIEAIRHQLLQNNKSITITDLGVGSKVFRSDKRKISDIAKYSVKKPKYGRLMFRLVNRFQPKTVLELGTSLGITTAYLAKPNSATKVYSIEGCPEIRKVAETTFNQLNITNVQSIEGNFDHHLPLVLNQLEKLDFAFFDGNHQHMATVNYFKQCLSKAHASSVFVFDDIHWSKDMEKAWEDIKNHPNVSVTVDLFFVGLVFFHKEQAKQHFTIRF
jgi:predicted O-methyltransferase YrrM